MSFGSSGYNNHSTWNRSSGGAHSSNISYQNVSSSMYPMKRPHSPDNYNNSYQQSSSTNKGRVSRQVFNKNSKNVDSHTAVLSSSACTKGIPKLKEQVLVEAIPSPGTTYKWRATKVMLTINGRDYSNLKPIPNSRPENDYRQARMLDRNTDRSRERRYDEIDRKRFKRDDKDDKIREFDKDSYKDREKSRDFDRSKSPAKRKLTRYSVKVPGELLTVCEGDIITLKKRYPTLYIPSDFFSCTIHWSETFPATKPYSFDKPCSFHIMHKECDPYIQNDAVIDPPDLDYTFSAKVLLMSVPRLDEVYKKTICLAEDLAKDDDRTYTHILRLIQFLVGSRSKNEPLAIGGPWSPSLDGDHPEKNPAVLIKTAIRTCKALTGIDLSACSQWYRFMEVYYHRSESVHKGKTYPARVETVVFFLPEVWNCVPSCLEWDSVMLNYKNLVEELLHPKSADETTNNSDSCEQADESDKEEDLVVIDKCEDKIEATHYSELDPQNMKVNDLKQELEARALSTKGLKHHLVQRLELAMKKERDIEEEEEEEAAKNVKEEPEKVIETDDAIADDELKVVDCVKEDDVSVNGEPKEEKKEISDNKVTEIIDPVVLEKRYAIPDTPHIVVHPSRTAKSGKFDCTIMSLASLLDCKANENKEHSFELFLFAKLFYEMLQRDFGFQIYKALCAAPEKVKEDDKKVDKETNKSNSPEKSSKIEEKEENTVKDEKNEKTTCDSKSVDEKLENKEMKKKDRVKLTTKDPFLLLSFVFFDKTQCGYIYERDLESLLFSLGLHLSRHQVKKLISKVAVREMIHYRKFTDKSDVEDDGLEATIDVESIAIGNKKYFPIFHNQTGRETSPSESRNEALTTGRNNSSIVCIDGSIVDIEKVTSNLKKNESLRLELENQLLKYKKDIDGFRESLKRAAEKEKRLTEEFKNCREKLTLANREKLSYTNKSRTYYKLLTNIKDQICSFVDKPERIVKTANLNEKVDEKTPPKNKKESSDDDDSKDKTDTPDKEKKDCGSEELPNANEKIDDNEKSETTTTTEINKTEETVA